MEAPGATGHLHTHQSGGEENMPINPDAAVQSPGDKLHEEIDAKRQTIEALQHENYKLRLQSTVSSSEKKEIIEQYNGKIQEFQSALNQRDQMIGKLQTRLAECIQNQDDKEAEFHEQVETHRRQVESLNLQLKKTTDSLLNKDWSSEHLQLQNKIQILMKQLQEVTRELTHNKEKHQVELTTVKEQFEQQLRVLKQQMSEHHSEELSRIKSSHDSELSQVTQQIDALEKAQKEDHTSLIENLNSLNNLNISLKEQLEGEKVKLKTLECSVLELSKEKELLKVEVERSKERENDLQLGLKQECNIRNELQHKFEELKTKYVELKNVVDIVKKEAMMLNENLKDEVEKRNHVEKQLAEELQNVKNLSGEKLNLENKLENINFQMNVMSNKLSQSKVSKENLNADYQKTLKKYNEVLCELAECKRLVAEREVICKDMREEILLWVAEKNILTDELRHCTEMLKIEVSKVENEIKSKFELEKEISVLKCDTEKLTKRCNELSRYEQDNKVLTEKLMQMHSDLKEAENKNINDEALRDKYLALFEQWQSVESNNKTIEEQCKEKCECLNKTLQSLDSKLEAASGITCNFQEIGYHNKPVEEKLKEAENNIDYLEEALMNASLEKEALVSDLTQARIAQDSMEREKNECETDRDRMLEQYKMMKAELASAQLALDREFQLSTHRRLTSDIGLSVSTSSILEPNTIRGESITDNDDDPERHAGKEISVDVKEFNISTIIRLKPQEKREKSNKFWEDKIHNLEKENKELLNEIEQLKTKIHDQHFSVKSLENEKLKLRSRLNELESEKVKFRAEQEDYRRNISEKMNLQRQLDELKLTVHSTEDNLKRQEEEMNLLQKSLKAIILRGNSDCSEILKDIVNNLDIIITKSKSNDSQNCSSYLKSCVSRQSEELQCMCEEFKKYMSELLDLLQHSYKLNEEKMQIELENLTLKAEVKKLKYLKSVEVCEEDIDHKFSNIMASTGDNEDWKVQRELHKYKHENSKLRLQVEKSKVLFRLEKLHLQSSLINSQKDIDLPVDIREMVTTYVGMELEKLIEEWEGQVKTDPSLADFISAQICKVCDIIRKLPGTLVESSDGGAYVESAMKLIQQAVIKNVGGQYMEVVKSLLAKLDKDVTKSLQITLPTVLLDLLKNISLSEDSHDPVHSEEVKSITDKVEHLINARNTLVEAANEFVEQLEAAVALRTSCIKHELDDLVKLAALKVAAKENSESSNASTPEELSLQVESQQQFVREFMEVTTNIYQEALSEKLQILKSQKMMVHKILEDNETKLHTVCQEHLENLRTVTNLPDAVKYSNDLVSSLEKTLSQEVSWVDQQYIELLEQYSYEQNRHKESQTLTLQELKNRLVGLFKSTDIETELKELKCQHKSELMKLREQHAMEVHRLERQLAARDQATLMALDDEVEQLRAQIDRDLDVRSCISNALCSELENIKIQVTQRHLQSLYSDRDWYKKTVGLLSHVTLQLLHYYSVAESYTTKSQDHKTNVANIEDHGGIQQPEMSSGKILDLSFLSDCMTDENCANQLNVLTEDSALSTGLISKTVYVDQGEDTELASNSGSVFDSTAMSEGMLDDVDKDEQVRSILTKSYPQLMSILKGRWDRVVVENLEKEVQELTISLQASAGMFKIFMHLVSTGKQELSSYTVREEIEDENVSKETVSDPRQPSQNCFCEASLPTNDTSSKAPEDNRVQTSKSEEKNESVLTGTFKAVLSAKEKLKSMQKHTKDIPTLKEDTLNVPTHSSQSEECNKLTLQDLDDLSESLSHLLSQDESLMNFTKLKPHELRDGDKLKEALKCLCQNAQASEGLKVKLHHLEGLLKGLEEEKKIISDENSRLNHYSKNLAMELQVAKDQIEELELGQQGQEGGAASTQYAARMEASKDIRERVRAALSVKNKSLMDHNELVARVGDLEGILEVVVRDNDIKVEALNFEVADLTQQLEVADRQLRSSRQFLEEHASERDQEMEDLMQTRDKLTNQLREKDTLLTQHASLEREVENLERQLREKSQELQDALASKEEIQVEHKAAVDKIWDLREIIQSLETQVDGKCVEVSELNARNDTLSAAIAQARQHSQDLTSQLEEHRCAASEQGDGHSSEQSLLQGSLNNEPEEDEENNSQQAGASLFMELRDEYGRGIHNVSGQMLLQIIEERLERTTRGLEALHLSASSASQSAEDLSEEDHLNVPAVEELEADDTISPASFDQRLDAKLLALERTMEAAVKYTRDLEMTSKNLRVEYEEVTAERDMLQEHSKEQLVQISSLEARLDELRRSDHPMNAELKQRLNVVQEDLEKKRTELTKKGREIEELKHNLSSTRGKLMSREEELQRMQSSSQPHSLPQTTSDQLLTKQRQLQDEVARNNKLIEKLKKELVSASNPNNIPSSLAGLLIEDKNAEIKELIEKLNTMKFRVNKVITFIANGGNLVECQALLKKVIERYEKFSDRLSDDEAPEVMRKSSHVQQRDLSSLEMHGINMGPSTSRVFSSKSEDGGSFSTHPSTDNLTLMSVQPDGPIDLSKISSRATNMTKVSHISEDTKDGASSLSDRARSAGKEDKEINGEENAALHTSPFEEDITITKKEYENLCSASDEVTVLRAQVDLLQEEISSLNNFQTRLEEDFKAAQELLEAREEEITQLSDEIEDTVPLPMQSETLQMQDKYFRLEEQVVELQERLQEATAINREYEEEMSKLDLRTKDLNQEIKKLQENINLLRKEIKQKEDLLDQKERDLQEVKDQIETNANQHEKKQKELCNEVKFLHEQLERLKQQHVEHSAAMQQKTEEVAQLSAQLDLVHSEMQERLSHTNREMTHLEEQYQKEISELKEEQILREKQLCSDYEERMAAQVSDLSVKLSKDKEEAIGRLQRFYKSALQESNKEKEQIQKELQDQLQMVDLCNRSQQTSQVCDLDALNAGEKQEPDQSGYLENTLTSYLKDGGIRADPDQSTRASSAVSDISDGDEPCDVASRVQRVMNKVHKDGIEMLTLIDLMFLQKHQTHLDSSQKSLISRSGLIASGTADGSIADLQEKSSHYDNARSEGIVITGERTQLLRHMAALEEELSKRDQEMKKKVGLLEFRLEQEMMSANEWKLSFEAEKKRTNDFMDQLRQEKLSSVDQVSELSLLRSQLFILRLQLQKTQEENSNFSENLDSFKKEVETLKDALQAERNNFSHVSKVLSQQRRLTAVTRTQQDNVIKDLRNSLDKERERNIVLYSNERSDRTCITPRAIESERIPSGVKNSRSTGRPTSEDLKMQLAVEQERFTELQRSYERECLKVVTQNEQAHAERARARVDLMEEQGKCAELTKTVRNLEMEKDALVRQISNDRERLQSQESRIRVLEGEIRKLEGDLRAQADAHQIASHRVRDEDTQLHVSYTRTLNKLGEAEAELCTLRHKLRTMTKDLELAKEKEEQLQKELTTEKMAINRLGLPALARINNLDEYFELQLKENLELCKSVLRLTDDRQTMRQKIYSLENTVTDLTGQLIEAKAALSNNSSIEKMLKKERSIWEREKTSLQKIISQKEGEITRWQEAGSRTPQNDNNAQLWNERMQHIYGKYVQCEHWRKALIWQKRYLLVVIKGYRDTEQDTLSRLHTMASSVNGSVRSEAAQAVSNLRIHRFRVGVLTVIAICRMKTMVQRYRQKRHLGSQVIFPSSNAAFTTTSTTAEASGSSRPGSSNQVVAGGGRTTFTGQTPPTKGPSNIPNLLWSTPSSSRRNLFRDEESPRLNEYIERLDNIHSALGLNPKNI